MHSAIQLPSPLVLPSPLSLCSTPLSGRSLFTTQHLSAHTTILSEPATYFYSHSLHSISPLSCSTCLSFYNAPGFSRAFQSFKGHKGYVHLLACVMTGCPEEKTLFDHLDFQDIQLSLHPDLSLLVTFISKWTCLPYQVYQDCLARLVSNCHGSRDPPDNGLYLLLSMTQNHSCLPNCFFYLQQSTVYVRTLKDIPADSQLTIGYIDQLYQPSLQRQQLLAYRGFTCACERCNGSIEIVRAFLCPKEKCEGVLCPEETLFKCQTCRHSCDYLAIAEEEEESVIEGRGGENTLHSRHYLVQQQLDSTLMHSGSRLSSKDFLMVAQQVIANIYWLHQTSHHPLCIQLLDLVAQKSQQEEEENQMKEYLNKAYEESVQVYGETADWTLYQKDRRDNGLPVQSSPDTRKQQEQCQLF